MNQRSRNVLIVLGLILLILAIIFFGNILTYILIAAVLSLLGRPIVSGLQRIPFGKKKMSNSLAAMCSLFVIWGIGIGFFGFIIPLIANELKLLSEIDISAVVEYLDVAIEQISEGFPKLKPDFVGEEGLEGYLQAQLVNVLNVGQVSDLFGGVASQIGNFFLMFFSVSFVLFFFLKDEGMLRNAVLVFVPSEIEERVAKVLRSTGYLLKRYFVGILIEVIGVMILDTIGFTIVGLGFSHAVVVGVFAGVMNVIPYIGPWIGGVFGVVVAVATHLGDSFPEVTLPLILLVLLVVVIVQVTDNILFQPVIYSSSVKAHPLEIFLVILMAGSMAGILGMILAIPVYTVVRVVAKEFLSEFKFIRKLTENIDG
jgi:predicted PurR-regulated permease PerM